MLTFAPYARQPGRKPSSGPQFGLRPISAADWLIASAEREARLAEKERLMARCPELVFQALSGSETAQAEALEMIRGHLCLPSPVVPSKAPLDAAARMVEEDLCLLQLIDGEYRLTAASVASPSYWRLADKLGKELLDIHDPVPELRTRIGARMRRFFHNLPAGRIFMRGNWFLHVSDRLFRLPEDLRPPRAGEPLALERLYLRCERQTLRRLPESGAVLFTIRVYLNPLVEVAEHPALAADLREALRSDDWAAAVKMQEVRAWREPLLVWLGSCQPRSAEDRPDRRTSPVRRRDQPPLPS